MSITVMNNIYQPSPEKMLRALITRKMYIKTIVIPHHTKMAVYEECWSWSSTTWWTKWTAPAALPTALLLQHTFICTHVTPLGSAGHTLSGPTEHPPAQPWSIFLSCLRFLQRKTKALLTTKQESRKRRCWTISSQGGSSCSAQKEPEVS